MSGHNKWSKIKRAKGAADQARGKLFTKLGKEIAVAAKMGGGNPEGNARLRHAISAARSEGMPKDNIERAIKKGTGELEGAAYEELIYEGYGPGGVALIVETTTDNKNRTVSDLRNVFKSHGGTLGESGSVKFLFSHHGLLVFDKQKWPEEPVTEVALVAGAEDVQATDATVDVTTTPNDVYRVREEFEKVGMHPISSGFSFVAKSPVHVDRDGAKKLMGLLADLEDHDDVQHVHGNFDVDESVLSELASNG